MFISQNKTLPIVLATMIAIKAITSIPATITITTKTQQSTVLKQKAQ